MVYQIPKKIQNMSRFLALGSLFLILCLISCRMDGRVLLLDSPNQSLQFRFYIDEASDARYDLVFGESVIIKNAKPLDITLRKSDVTGLTILDDSTNQNLDNFAQHVLDGLKSEQKTLSPKYFYDQIGSDLFVKITKTDEYYPTRTEQSILNHYSDSIVDTCDDVNWLVELGSGSSEKTDSLLCEFHKKRKTFK